MPLSQSEINRSTKIAALLVKGKTEESLREWHKQLQTEMGEVVMVQYLYDLFYRISSRTRFEFAEDIVRRIKSSLDQRFASLQ